MDFLEFGSNVKTRYQFTIDQNPKFGEFTLIRTKTIVESESVLGDKVTTNARCGGQDMVVLTSYYEEQVRKHGKNPGWIQEVPEANHLEEAVHPAYLAAYKLGEHGAYLHERKNRGRLTTDLNSALTKDHALLVRDRTGYDHFFYDLHGRKVFRAFTISQLDSVFDRRTHKMKKMLAYLSEHPQVSKARLERVEHYNANFDGDERACFTYTPKDDQEFRKLAQSMQGIGLFRVIAELINLDQFKKEEDDD